MACTSYTLSGLNATCKEGKGGVLKVWIAPFGDVTPTPDAAEANGIINTVGFADGDYAKFKCYAFRRNTASLTSTLEVNDNAGNIYTSEVTLDFLKQDATKRVEIAALLATPCVVIIKDANEVYHFMGATYAVEASAATAETGTGVADPNHYSITLQDQDDHLPYLLNATAITGIEAITPPAL